MINAEHQAEDLIKTFELSIPINPVDVCNAITSKSLSITYLESELSTDNVCGMTIATSSSVHIVVNAKLPKTRRLFTAGHEIGHVVLHHKCGDSKFNCSNSDLTADGIKLEDEANKFSAALLLPRFSIEKVMQRQGISWALIKEIADKHQVSLEVAARRVVATSKEPCALIVHRNNQMWYPIKSTNFPHFIPNTQFPKYLNASSYKNGNLNEVEFDECDLTDWGINRDASKYVCSYSSISSDKYSQIMTLLVIDEIDEDEANEEEWDPPHF